MSGRYHDMGAFAGDIANLSRIVTLHNLNIAQLPKDTSGNLVDGSHRAHLPLPRR